MEAPLQRDPHLSSGQSLREIHVPLKRESCGELQHTWKTAWANFLEGSEIADARVGHQVARLIRRCTITTVGADGVVLQLVDPVAVLHVIVGVVEHCG